MKVILLQELKGKGAEGDVVEVARGYAVNYLFPKKVAIEATRGSLKQLELRKHNVVKREAERLDTAEKLFAALNESVITMYARVGEGGQLFGSVTSSQISMALEERFGVAIDRKKIDLAAVIKTAGEHRVTVSVYRDLKATVIVKVVDERVLRETPKTPETPAASETPETPTGKDDAVASAEA